MKTLICPAIACLGLVCTSAGAAGLDSDKLELSSDFRFRYEIDNADDKDNERDRARIRYRLGLKYQFTESMEFGARLRTNSSSVQSGHQSLGQVAGPGSALQRSNSRFGLDRAYLKYRLGEGGFLWMGKNQVALWQQNEQFWDSDFQAEGIALGNIFKLGNNSRLTVQGGYYYINETGFEFGAGQDDVIVPVQLVYEHNFGSHDIVLAATTASMADRSGLIPGGDEQYSSIGGQLNLNNLPVPLTLGYDTFFSGDSNTGFVASVRTRLDTWTDKLRLRLDWVRMPYDAVPAQGMISQDNFRFSSNFEGIRIQVDYDVMKDYNISLRLYPQSTLDENLITADVPGLGSYVQRIGDTTRYQVNFNVRF